MVLLRDILPLHDYSSFTDESCISHRFMLIGGVICATRDVAWIADEARKIIARDPFASDSLQWKHARRKSKWPKYKALIELFNELNSEHALDFAVIVIDRSKLKHSDYNSGDGEAFFQKMMCEFVEAKSRRYDPAMRLRCFHGQRESRFSLTEVKRIINNTLLSVQRRPALVQMEYAEVSKSPLHQIADTLLGSVGHHWNASLRRDPSSLKSMIARYANSECCVDSLAVKTPPWVPHFNIWEFKLRG